MNKLIVCLVILCVSSAFGAGLIDNPIVGDSITYLDGKWQLKSLAGDTITGQVPGDIITDLFNAGKIPEPYYETNWIQNASVWMGTNWTYSTQFNNDATGAQTLLVFDGIKMGAVITLNGVILGIANDQFLRYNFSVQKLLKTSGNILQVTFPAKYAINTEGRFMACTGGWDWAPYSKQQSYGANVFTQGIWKSVYLVSISSLAITHVVPQVMYLGKYPTAILPDDGSSVFEVTVKLFLTAPEATSGTIKVVGAWGGSNSTSVKVPAGDSVISLTLPAKNVLLWWPTGLGNAHLYNLTVAFISSTAFNPIVATRQVGFRVFSLVTVNDTDPTPYEDKNGSGNFTMRWKVNGANIYSRGGNMIPLEEFEGKANADAFTYLLQSVVDGGLNTLRIWGGGIFLYDVFYDTCDELGILIYHDMMYAQGGHSPANTTTQDAELRHQVRRLSHHPSIVMWDGCNECGGGGLYADFVIAVVASEDQSRVIWPSSPSYGWESGVSTLYGIPNGKPLISRTSGHTFETHGPYQHGAGYPAVNGNPNMNSDLFNPNIPPSLNAPSKTGVNVEGFYASEFGCVAMSSFESMSVYLAPDHWTLHTPAMSQRNYPCDNIIFEYFGAQNNSLAGEFQFKRQLYQCMLGQALQMKSNIENRRSGNEFGTIIWQLGEIWPTGGWGSLEYASPENGQVLGGRWKPLHYFLRNALFSDVITTCGTDGHCYIKNDGVLAFSGRVRITIINLSNGKETIINTNEFSLPAGAGTMQWFCFDGSTYPCSTYSKVLSQYGCTEKTCVLQLIAITLNNEILSNHILPLVPPGNLTLTSTLVTFTIFANHNGGATITLTNTGGVAPYTVLTTQAYGRFDDNAFLLLPGITTVDFIPFGNFSLSELSSTLRVEYLQNYVNF